MKFFRRLLILIIAFVLADQLAGVCCRYLHAHAKGSYSRAYYIANEMETDMLILGGSRAFHHYNPAIIADSLHMNVYNAGLDGMGIIYNYGIWKLVTQRSYPKILVYETGLMGDLYQSDNKRYLSELKYFIGCPAIDSLFIDIDPQDFVFSHINLYKYNSMVVSMIKNYLSSPKSYVNGFSPHENNTDIILKPGDSYKKKEGVEYDSLKLKYLEKLMKECQGRIKFFMVESPAYSNTQNDALDTLKALCNKYGGTFIDYSVNADFNNDASLFYDVTHLNAEGADKFSSSISHDIKTLLEQ